MIERILDRYLKNIKSSENKIEFYKSLSFRYSMIRLAVFILAIPALYFIIKTNMYVFFLFLIAVLGIFIWAILKQQKYDKLLNEQSALEAINKNEITVIENQQNLYYNGEQYSIHNHLYTEDLDIFGAHSIFGLINRCRTYFGNQNLKDAFLSKPSKDDLLNRQEAIKELSEDLDWRQEFASKLYDLEDVHDFNISAAIDQQMEMDLSFAENPLLNIYRKSLPLIWIVVAVLYYMGSGYANTLASILFIGNLLLVGNFTKKVSEIQARLSNTSNSLKSYIDVLDLIFSKKWNATLLKEYKSQFDVSSGEMPVKSLSQLSTTISQLDYRLNLLFAISGNGLFLWDLYVVNKLSLWKKNNTGKIESLLQYIGKLECLSSLAAWSYNHPESTYLDITDTYMELEMKDAKHPLIPDNQNVANDFVLNSTDEVTIITGSNMSGKSTLLRTIGINLILGYTGTKVTASAFKAPIVTLVSYMRIKDALEENVSTFKAELNRIKMILSLLETDDRPFILIDEMLRGTNSKDKLNGSIGITKKLLDSDAYAMIATHDIKLAELGNTDKRIANYYFDIDYADGDLVFDYKVKKGICENFNASFLLGQLGIETTPDQLDSI